MPKYSDADVTALTEKMAAERAALFNIVQDLSDDLADFVPQNAEGEEQWTAKEQLAHLLESDRVHTSFGRTALKQDGADITQVRLTVGEGVAITVQDAPSHSIAEIVAAMKEERARSLEFIGQLSLADFERTAKDNEFGSLTVMQWLRSFYRHDRQHGAQIEGRQSEYRPNFQSGREPNQRQARIDQVEARDGS